MEIVRTPAPGGSTLASSIHDSGDAIDVAGVTAGSELLLGGVLCPSLFRPGASPLLPCAAAGSATASVAMTLAATSPESPNGDHYRPLPVFFVVVVVVVVTARSAAACASALSTSTTTFAVFLEAWIA